MEQPTVEQKAEELARRAAERAAHLAMVDAQKAQEIAVARAIRDANVDRDLSDHSRHLEEINGSQREMAKSLAAVEKTQARAAIATETLATYISEQSAGRVSRRTLWIAGLGSGGAYLGLLGLIISQLH